MAKKTVFTNITPLPSNVSREVAIAMLHNHDEMIELNPLVIEHHPILPPSNAAKDEYQDCVWQEMTDRISLLPGGVANRKVTYRGCFHDMPNGLQTHVYAPMGLDIRERWTIGGSLPGEADEARELGLNLPSRGLYLREDGEMKCNMLMSSLVRKNLDNAHKTLVHRILTKAERVQTHIDSISRTQSGISQQARSSPGGSAEVRHSNSVGQTTGNGDETRSSASFRDQGARAPSQHDHQTGTVQHGTEQHHHSVLHEMPDGEIDRGNLHNVHPAIRADYEQSDQSHNQRNVRLPTYNRLDNQRGQYYQDDLAKRPQGRQVVSELEGSIPETTYGAPSEVDDNEVQVTRDDDPIRAYQRNSTISAISEVPSPGLSQSRWKMDAARYSMVSAMTEENRTPPMPQQTFAHQQATIHEQARSAQERSNLV